MLNELIHGSTLCISIWLHMGTVLQTDLAMVVGHYLSPQDSRVLTLSTLQQAYTSHMMLILITQCCYILHEVCINRCQSIDDGFYLSFFLVSNMKFPC